MGRRKQNVTEGMSGWRITECLTTECLSGWRITEGLSDFRITERWYNLNKLLREGNWCWWYSKRKRWGWKRSKKRRRRRRRRKRRTEMYIERKIRVRREGGSFWRESNGRGWARWRRRGEGTLILTSLTFTITCSTSLSLITTQALTTTIKSLAAAYKDRCLSQVCNGAAIYADLTRSEFLFINEASDAEKTMFINCTASKLIGRWSVCECLI